MMVKNESEMLAKTLPVLCSGFEHRIAIDTGSSDDSEDVLRRFGFHVEHRDWKSDFASARNELLEIGTQQRFDWVVMMDADEAMWPKDAAELRKHMNATTAAIIALPRFNIAGQYDRWWRPEDKDMQARVVRLGQGVRWIHRVHEVPVAYGRRIENVPIPIFHYGLCKSSESMLRRHLTYIAISKGQPEPIDLPEAQDPDFSHLQKFPHPHPLSA